MARTVLSFGTDGIYPLTRTLQVPLEPGTSGVRVELTSLGGAYEAHMFDAAGSELSAREVAATTGGMRVLFAEEVAARGRLRLAVTVPQAPAEHIAVMVETLQATALFIAGALSARFIYPGESLYILATPRDGEQAAAFGEVAARVVTPTGDVTIVSMNDSGQGFDMTAGDGMYVGVLEGSHTANLGTYYADIQGDIISGELTVARRNTINFEVFEERNLRVVPNTLAVTPNPPQADACNQVVFDVENQSAVTSAHALVADLYQGNPSGGGILLGSRTFDLAPGQRTSLTFSWNPGDEAAELVAVLEPPADFLELRAMILPHGDKTVRAANDDNRVSLQVIPRPAVPAPVQLGVTAPARSPAGLPVNLYAAASPEGSIISWLFTGPSFTWARTGSRVFIREGFPAQDGLAYNVTTTVTATSPAGLTATVVRTIRVPRYPEISQYTATLDPSSIDAPKPPVAAISAPVSVFALQPVAFDSTGSADNYGLPVMRWSIGRQDSTGNTYAGPRVSFPRGFDRAGTYLARLTVNDLAKLGPSSAVRTLTVQKRPTSLSLAVPASTLSLEAGKRSLVPVQLLDTTPGQSCAVPRLLGKPIRARYHVSSPGGAFADAAVNADAGSDLAYTNAGGVARVAVTPPFTGTLSLSVVFAGDATYDASSLNVTLSHPVSDRTPPFLLVVGVAEGAIYEAAVNVFFAALDGPSPEAIVPASATLDGLPVANGAQVSAYGEHTLEVVGTDREGNTATRVIRFSIMPKPAGMGFALCGREGLALENSASAASRDRLTGLIGEQGYAATGGTLTLSNSAVLSGDVVVGGDLLMQNLSTIRGSVYLAGRSQLLNGSRVEGSILSHPGGEDLCTCGYDVLQAMTAAADNNDNERLAAIPALATHLIGGALVVHNGGRVVLPAGSYFLTGLELRNSSELSVERGARVNLYVAGPIRIENTSRLNFPPAQAARVSIVSAQSADLSLANATENAFALYAPLAAVEIVNSSLLVGSITGRTVRLVNSGTLLRDVWPGAAEGIVLSCPIVE